MLKQKLVCNKKNVMSFISIVYISTNFALDCLLFWMHVPNSYVEGTVFEISNLGLSFCFMSKDGKLFFLFTEYFFLYIIKEKKSNQVLYQKSETQFHKQHCVCLFP